MSMPPRRSCGHWRLNLTTHWHSRIWVWCTFCKGIFRRRPRRCDGLSFQNSDPVLNYNLGLSLMYEKATDQAREQFERALQLKPNFAAAAYQLALVSERLNIPQA